MRKLFAGLTGAEPSNRFNFRQCEALRFAADTFPSVSKERYESILRACLVQVQFQLATDRLFICSIALAFAFGLALKTALRG